MPGQPVRAKSPLTALFCAAIAVMITPTTTLADTGAVPDTQKVLYYDPSDGNQRINLSGRLRMLSQRISGMACNHAAGIEADASYTNLQAAVDEYNTILHGLEFGDPELDIIGAEINRGIIRGVHNVEDRWTTVSLLADAVLEGEVSDENVATLASETSLLLREAQKLVVRIVEFHYDRVNTIQSVAMTIDFAGRQRMLAQKMSKNICLIHMDSDTEAALADLKLAYGLFDATLAALQVGMLEVGVSPPPNETVADGLAVVAASWSTIEPTIAQAIEGQRFDDEMRRQLFHDLNRLTGEMNAAVQMYVAASR